jgi:hypothetical protein
MKSSWPDWSSRPRLSASVDEAFKTWMPGTLAGHDVKY